MRAHRFLLLLSLTVTGAVSAQDAPLTRPALAAMQEAHAAPALLDVRTSAEYHAGHIDGALNVAVDELAARHGVLGFRHDQDIVVYCKSGRRATRARQILQSLGYTRVRLLDGSIDAWQAERRPLVVEGRTRS